MQLTEGETIDVAGTIDGRQVVEYGEGQTMANAALLPDGGGAPVQVVWWQHGRAPPDGARVRVSGVVKEFKGQLQVHAEKTGVERAGSAGGAMSSIAAFYLACVEAEAAGALRLRPDDGRHIVLCGTTSPLHGPVCIPEGSRHDRWFRDRQREVGEALLAGWPLVVGPDTDTDTDTGGLVTSPLLIAETELRTSDGAWRIQCLDPGAELNPFALDLLEPGREAREELVSAVQARVEVEESATSAARAQAILRALRDEGVRGLDTLDPASLSSAADGEGIHNAGAVIAAAGGLRATRNLAKDLEEIANYPELVSKGPAAVLLGHAPAPDVPLPAPHPTVGFSSLRQDQAVHSAMVNDFTVVTGPPGTGKSQVLVNVVAAAVARGETVLFASKNNRAVDVVVDRLRVASPSSVVIRAGAAGRRNEVAKYIADALSSDLGQGSPAAAHRAWDGVEKQLRRLYGSLHERRRLELERDDRVAKLKAAFDRLPPGTGAGTDIAELDAALAQARNALDAFGDRLGLIGRWRRHRARLERARRALERVGDVLGIRSSDIEACLSSVSERPERTLAPRRDFRPVEQVAGDLREVAEHRREIHRPSPGRRRSAAVSGDARRRRST